MAEELVTIAHEFSPLKANLIRTRLEADGIECFLHGETLTGVVGSLSYASASWNHPEGNIALQVPLSQATLAREILREIESAPRDETDEEWTRPIPRFAVALMRGLIIVALVVSMTIWIGGATQNWSLGVTAGTMTLLALCFFGFKNSFTSKR